MSLDTDIFGMAMQDYLNDNYTADIKVISSIADEDIIPVPYLFRSYEDMPDIEQKALDLCKGKVLDVGCGAGVHSLYLQEKGMDVTAIDTSAGAIDICKKQGVKNAECTAFLNFKEGKYDTIILLMNGTGIFGNLKKLPQYIDHLKELLADGGQILLDSSDLIYMYEEEDGSLLIPSDYYYGEVTYRTKYKNKKSKEFDWLYIHYGLLKDIATNHGLTAEKVMEGPHYDYLARLTKN